jgi:hypothetical protein
MNTLLRSAAARNEQAIERLQNRASIPRQTSSGPLWARRTWQDRAVRVELLPRGVIVRTRRHRWRKLRDNLLVTVGTIGAFDVQFTAMGAQPAHR